VGVSRMTRPVKIFARGRQPGQAATLQCLAEQVTGCLYDPTDGAGRWRFSERHRTIVLGRAPHHFPRLVMGAERVLSAITRRRRAESRKPNLLRDARRPAGSNARAYR